MSAASPFENVTTKLTVLKLDKVLFGVVTYQLLVGLGSKSMSVNVLQTSSVSAGECDTVTFLLFITVGNSTRHW